MAVLDTQEAQLRADVKAKQAALDLAKINLGYTRILAPVDGMVERGVRDGQYVHAEARSSPSCRSTMSGFSPITIETQLTHVAIGQRAEIRVDTFPGVVITAMVDSIAPASGATVQPAAAGQCDRQFYQGRAADSGQIADRTRQSAGRQIAAGDVGHRDDPHRHHAAIAMTIP
jgi:multidrug resistance efflux pump